MSQFKLGYRPQLDGLRGTAILLVVAVNASWKPLQGGFIGVDIFFALSGFLISALLLEEYRTFGKISMKGFLLRRALRLIPALSALLIISITYAAVNRSGSDRIETFYIVGSAFLFVSNWLIWITGYDATLLHTWSLGIEFQFYLFWSLLFWLLSRKLYFHRNLAGITLLAIISIFACRTILWLAEASQVRLYMSLETRLDSILIGAASGIALYSFNEKTRALFKSSYAKYFLIISWTTILATATLANYKSPFPYLGGFSLIALSTTIIIISSLSDEKSIGTKILSNPFLGWTGRISYSLYLWHVPLGNVITSEKLLNTGIPYMLVEPIRITCFFAVASGSYYLIERPASKLKNRFARIKQDRCCPS